MSNSMAIVLAAGRGTRMQSDLPKVLFPVLRRPMIQWVLDAVEGAGISQKLIVVGYREELVREELRHRHGVRFAIQEQQLGTGHAVQVCRDQIAQHDGSVLIVAGDSPLIQPTSILRLLHEFHAGDYACLLGTLIKDNPIGLGRIVRGENGVFQRIVEEKDANPSERQICEVNMSTYLFRSKDLLLALDQLSNANVQGEYYLTDCPELLLQMGKRVDAKPVLSACEALSINTINELGAVEAKMLQMGYKCEN